MKNDKWLDRLLLIIVCSLLTLNGVYTISEVELLYRIINHSSGLKEQMLESFENLAEYGINADSNVLSIELQEQKKITVSDIKENAREKMPGPLIQTVNEKEEALGMIRLGLLEVATNKIQNLDVVKQLVAPTITKISMGNYYGSGVIYSIDEKNVILISNKHLLEEGKYGEVTFFNGKKIIGEVFGISQNYDMGFMKVKIPDIPHHTFMKLRYIAIDNECYKRLHKGDEVVQIGSADGVAENQYEGVIGDMWWYAEEFNSHMIYNYCYAKAGMSGGGTFDAHGHYIGMITGGNEEESVSLPLITIAEEYETIIGREHDKN